MDDRARLARKLDRLLDRYAADAGYANAELLLQQRSQAMRELARKHDAARTIPFDEVDGYIDD